MMSQQRILWGLAVVAWTAVIAFESSIPEAAVVDATAVSVFARAIGHIVAYMILSALSYRASGKTAASIAWVVVYCYAVGVFDEWNQSLTPGRYSSTSDLSLDGIGIALALWWERKPLQ